jgi:hypothetical protein
VNLLEEGEIPSLEVLFILIVAAEIIGILAFSVVRSWFPKISPLTSDEQVAMAINDKAIETLNMNVNKIHGMMWSVQHNMNTLSTHMSETRDRIDMVKDASEKDRDAMFNMVRLLEERIEK